MDKPPPAPNATSQFTEAAVKAVSAAEVTVLPPSPVTFAEWDSAPAAGSEPYARMWPLRIAVLGLDGAGKTTFLYRLESGGGLNTSKEIPTIGFSCEVMRGDFQSQAVEIHACDVWPYSTPSKVHAFQPLQILSASHALLWIVDASDLERLIDSACACHALFRAGGVALRGRPILLVCNKQDRVNARHANDLSAAAIALLFQLPGYAPLAMDSPHASAIAAELASAIPLPPLVRLILSYCTLDSSFVRVIETCLGPTSPLTRHADATAPEVLTEALEWLIRACYHRVAQTHPADRTLVQRWCTLM